MSHDRMWLIKNKFLKEWLEMYRKNEYECIWPDMSNQKLKRWMMKPRPYVDGVRVFVRVFCSHVSCARHTRYKVFNRFHLLLQVGASQGAPQWGRCGGNMPRYAVPWRSVGKLPHQILLHVARGWYGGHTGHYAIRCWCMLCSSHQPLRIVSNTFCLASPFVCNLSMMLCINHESISSSIHEEICAHVHAAPVSGRYT